TLTSKSGRKRCAEAVRSVTPIASLSSSKASWSQNLPARCPLSQSARGCFTRNSATAMWWLWTATSSLSPLTRRARSAGLIVLSTRCERLPATPHDPSPDVSNSILLLARNSHLASKPARFRMMRSPDKHEPASIIVLVRLHPCHRLPQALERRFQEGSRVCLGRSRYAQSSALRGRELKLPCGRAHPPRCRRWQTPLPKRWPCNPALSSCPAILLPRLRDRPAR